MTTHAAGIMLVSPQGRVLVLQRAASSDYPGTWCFPGGCIEGDETPSRAAQRECMEETGFNCGAVDAELCARLADDVYYTTFTKKVDDEFVPKLNDEHTAWAWVSPAEIVAPLLPVTVVPPPAPVSPPVETIQ